MDPGLEDEETAAATAAAVNPCSTLFEKIGYLQALTMELVSRPDDSSQQQLREIETLLDRVMAGTEGILQLKGGGEDESRDSKALVSGSGIDTEVFHCSSSLFAAGKEINSGSSSSDSIVSEKFDLDTVFDALADQSRQEQLQQQQQQLVPKLEEGQDTDEFMSYLANLDEDDQSELHRSSASLADLRKDQEHEEEFEALPPGSYDLIELDAMEILAEHTHFCDICGKGFKRDANLRMHMRGHGDEYKTAAALSKPKLLIEQQLRVKRYSCPYAGCKRHKLHPKFAPLKTVLCVKNHYRRSHCPKMLACSKCRSKRFSVLADLRTHEKHCGREKWMCSCGTSFSRKDKLLGHVGLFVGHAPVPKRSSFGAVSGESWSSSVAFGFQT